MSRKYTPLAWTLFEMWNSQFSKVIYSREYGSDIRLSPVNMFNFFSSTNRYQTNKHIENKAYKNPTISLMISSFDKVKLGVSIWLNDKPSNKWIIACHGYNSDRFGILFMAWHYRQLGYNILTFDFRNHGASDRNIITWGYKEKEDLKSVIEWLYSRYKIEIAGIIGTSMGGFTTNHFILTEHELIKKANIKWAITDAAYFSIKELIVNMIKNNAPKIFEGYTQEVLNDVLNIYKFEYGIDLEGMDFLSSIKLNSKNIPVMYIHGRHDRLVQYTDAIKMYDIKNNIEKSSQNKLLIFDNGKHHTKTLVEFPDEYINQTFNFVLNSAKTQ